MTVFLTVDKDAVRVYVQARAEGEGVVGDVVREVGPDEDFLGWSYDKLVALGDGRHDVEVRGQ
jgi:hypothetical protein